MTTMIPREHLRDDVLENLRDDTWVSSIERLLNRRLHEAGVHEHELIEAVGISPRRWQEMLSSAGRHADDDERAELAFALGISVQELPL